MTPQDDEYITHARDMMNESEPAQPVEIVIAEVDPDAQDNPTAEGVAERSADQMIEDVYRDAWNCAQ